MSKKRGDTLSLEEPDTGAPTTQVNNGQVQVKAFAQGDTSATVKAIIYTGTVPPADNQDPDNPNYTDLPPIGNHRFQAFVPNAPALGYFRIHLIATFDPAGATEPPRIVEDDRGYFFGLPAARPRPQKKRRPRVRR